MQLLYSPRRKKTTIKMAITNSELFDKARESGFQALDSLRSFVLERKNVQQQDADTVELDLFLENFLRLAKKKWRESGAHKRVLERKFGYAGGWLHEEAAIPKIDAKKPTPRKVKPFDELSKRSKNRLTEELRTSNEASKLVHAASSSLRAAGRSDFAQVISEADKSPTRAKKFRRLSGIADSMESVPRAPLSLPQRISDEDALVHLFHTNMTKEAYISNRLMCKKYGADIWPPYQGPLAVKKSCRPEGIVYQETSVIVPIQERLRHNDSRLMKIFDIKFQSLLSQLDDGATLEVEAEEKIGFDGSTGNSAYNQAFSLDNRDTSDESLLSTGMVPLRYQVKNGEIIFLNPTPQGGSFCQPVRLEYRKETAQASREIDAWIDEAIDAVTLTPNVIQVGSKFVKFEHRLLKTMMDGKAKNACTETGSSLTCFVCGASAKHFNKLEDLATLFKTDPSKLVYGGIADLHAWLRSFDAINSLSDKLTLKKWRVTSNSDKAQVAARKEERQKKFKDKLGLIVDVPKSGGAGNSNTGNVARKAFQDEAAFSEITGVDQELIHRIHVLLIVINMDLPISEDKFKAYALATAERWVSLYDWYYMPVTLHQLFFHAWESLRLSTLPLSFLSEQSLESCNKTFKSDREHHARKDSRLHTIEDQFNRQSDRSDLVIALKLAEKQKKKAEKPLPQDAQDLLVGATGEEEEEEEEEEA